MIIIQDYCTRINTDYLCKIPINYVGNSGLQKQLIIKDQILLHFDLIYNQSETSLGRTTKQNV